MKGNIMIRMTVIILTIITITGCTPTIKSTVMPGINMNDYKTAYVRGLFGEDEFGATGLISSQLSQMGYRVIAKNKPDTPASTDMLVSFETYGWWDFVRYLRSFQIQFTDATTNASLGSIYFQRHGYFGYEPNERVADAFKAFREVVEIETSNHEHPSVSNK
jgi:hypothetical protein